MHQMEMKGDFNITMTARLIYLEACTSIRRLRPHDAQSDGSTDEHVLDSLYTLVYVIFGVSL